MTTRTCSALVLALVAALGLPSPSPAQSLGSVSRPGGASAAGPSVPVECDSRIPIDSIPITLTQKGSYYLTASLTGVSGQHGIQVLASDVAIDLNGHTLFGVSGALRGITTTARRTTVRNGGLVGWPGGGVRLGEESAVERVRAVGSISTGIFVGARSIVRQCIATGNSDGVELGGGGLAEHVVASGNSSWGFLLGGTHGTVRHCVASGNGLSGISIVGAASHWSIVRNTVCRSGQSGIEAGAASLVLENNASENGTQPVQAGIVLFGATSSRAERNLSARNMRAFTLPTSGGHVVAGNATIANPSGWFIAGGNDVGPFSSASSTNPWANIVH